ncbi:MAG: hypothetical protein AB1473_19805 [Thermodesulfobacteriota bacterium]
MFAFLIDFRQPVVLQYTLLADALAGVAGNVMGAFVLAERIT